MPNISEHLRHLRTLQPLLTPLGQAYGLLMRARRCAYESGRFHRWRPPCPCISVGNIGMGGSGKTPLCAHILQWADARDELGVVLTRGYGAKPGRLPLLVLPGANPAQAGDEPLLLASASAKARVVVDPLRARSGPWAYKRFDPDYMLLDDGFQHLPVERDLDLVLLTPRDLGPGWNRVCPAGGWREGASALSRASAFCIKVGEDELFGLRAGIERRLARFGRPVFTFALRPVGLERMNSATRQPEATRDLGGEDYLFSCGLGDPEQAAATAARLLGRAPKAVLSFADHRAYTQADVRRITEAAQAAGAAHVVVTAKDAVKLARLDGAESFWTLSTRLVFGPSLFADAPEIRSFDHWLGARFDALAGHYRQKYREAVL